MLIENVHSQVATLKKTFSQPFQLTQALKSDFVASLNNFCSRVTSRYVTKVKRFQRMIHLTEVRLSPTNAMPRSILHAMQLQTKP